MTRWVTILLVANVAIWFLQQAVPQVTYEFLWLPADAVHRPWTAVTAMFLHSPSDFWHILFNMLGLAMFGPRVESRLGEARFLGLYFTSGIVGSLFCFLQPNIAVLGASGALFGVSLAYARYWPTDTVMIYGIIPMTTRMSVIVFAIISAGGAISPIPLPFFGNVAHLGHLGGFAGGWLFCNWMERFSGAKHFRQRAETGWTAEVKGSAPVQKVIVELATGEKETLERWGRIAVDQLHPVNREEHDRIRAKIATDGLRSLTALEREFMERFAALAG